MRKYFLLLLLFGFLNVDYSQWYQQQVPTNINFLLSIDFNDSLNGVSCGWFDFYGRAIYTTNGGINWQNAVVPDSSRSLVNVSMINSTTGFIAGAYNITASKQQPVILERNIPFSISNILHNIGNDGIDLYKGLFLKTTDSGHSWFTFGNLPDSIYYLIGLSFVNNTTGYVTADLSSSVGSAGILKTTNGGLTWIKLNIPQGIYTLWQIEFNDVNTGFAVGTKRISDTLFNAVVLRTTDGGNVWETKYFTDVSNLLDINFSNSFTGFASGAETISGIDYGTVLKTTNAGLNWNKISTVSNAQFFMGANFVKNTGTAFIFGGVSSDASIISRTNNYGNTWFDFLLINDGTYYTNGIAVDNNNWFICGGDFPSQATILKTSNGGNPIGIKPVSNSIPKEFKLYQNYPNPFNPSTKIKFDVPAEVGSLNSEVRLVIYDILGKEITSLINQQLQPGTYEVKWEAGNYPSGVYFYKLEYEGFMQIKKMILLK